MNYKLDPYVCCREYQKLRSEFEEVNYDLNNLQKYANAKIKHLSELVLEMGYIIRFLDEDCEYLEYWTQDCGYNYFGVDKENLS